MTAWQLVAIMSAYAGGSVVGAFLGSWLGGRWRK